MQDVNRTLQMILHCCLDSAQRFWGKNERGHNRAAERLWHSEMLDAVIKGDSELLCQENNCDEIKEEERCMIKTGAHVDRLMNRVDRSCRRPGFHEVLAVPHGLDKEKNAIEAQG